MCKHIDLNWLKVKVIEVYFTVELDLILIVVLADIADNIACNRSQPIIVFSYFLIRVDFKNTNQASYWLSRNCRFKPSISLRTFRYFRPCLLKSFAFSNVPNVNLQNKLVRGPWVVLVLSPQYSKVVKTIWYDRTNVHILTSSFHVSQCTCLHKH